MTQKISRIHLYLPDGTKFQQRDSNSEEILTPKVSANDDESLKELQKCLQTAQEREASIGEKLEKSKEMIKKWNKFYVQFQ